MRCLVSNLSLQWLKSVCPRLPLDQCMRELPAGALNRLQAKFLYILSTRRFGNNGDARTSNSIHSDGRTKHRCQRRGCEVVNAGSPACEVRVTAEHRASENTTKTRPARHLYGRNVEMETSAGVATKMGLPDRQSQYKQLLRIKLLHSVNIYARGRGEGPVVTWRIQLYVCVHTCTCASSYVPVFT